MAAAKLTRSDWIAAAVHAMGEHGVSGIAVEPLAKSLGATKGSFYWHFRDRNDLVTAALERWEQEATDAVIAKLSPVDDGRARLRQLFQALFVMPPPDATSPPALAVDASHRAVTISIALSVEREHPAVVEVLTRVTARRIAYVAEQFVALGIDASEAHRRALLAYTAYVGFSALGRSVPAAMPREADAQRFVDTMLAVLTMGSDEAVLS